jgi:putative ABC transport system permease protein
METFWRDVRFGVRMLWKSRGFTVVAVLVLTLGIGANSAIFSIVNAILLRPLPYEDSGKLVFLAEWSKQVPNMSFSVANFQDVRDQNKVFESLFAFRSGNYVMTGEGEPERLLGRQVTSGIFPAMRVQPILGRAFTPEEDKPGAERVVLLGEGFWTRRFARDPNVLGKTLTLSGESFTVIGVLPATFHGTWRQADLWVSLGRLFDQLGGPQNRGNHPGIYVIGRRRPGVSEEQARADIVAIAQRLAQEYPQSSANQSMTARDLHEAVVGDLERPLFVLLGAVAFVLLIACANVANLMLSRGAARQKEIAVRIALGAGRGRLVRQFLTESTLLALVGGMIGLGLAYAGLKGLLAVTPTNVPRVDEIRLDGAVLSFTMLVSLLTGIVFGLVPALQVSKPDVHETLKEGGRAGSGAARHLLRSSLAVVEICLAFVLLIGSGLMLRSFYRLLLADAGYNPESVLTASVAAPQAKYDQPPKVRAFIEQVLTNVKALPGVEAAASTTPLLGGWQTSFLVEGKPAPPLGQVPSTDISRVSPDYFRAMGVRLLRGRTFTEQDHADAPRVCIVDETFARTYWPDEDPIGRKIRLGGLQSQQPWMEVVGVVAHVKNYGVDQESRVETYLPYPQSPVNAFTLVVRTKVEPTSLTSALRDAVRRADPDIPIFSVRTMEQIVSDNVASRRLAVVLLGVFAGLAMLLAAVGLYGVMSYNVAQRTHEIGIRMALGAQPGDVLRLVVRQGMMMALLGVAIGLAGSLALTRVVKTLLFQVSATDPATFAGISSLLVVVTVLATYIPARRATRVDPVIALRYE